MVKCTKEVMQLASEIKGLILDENDLSDGEVIDSIYDIVKKYDIHEQEVEEYARVCDITGEPMNEGWVWNHGESYTKYSADVQKECEEERDNLLESLKNANYLQADELIDADDWNRIVWNVKRGVDLTVEELVDVAVGLDMLYWTEWEDEDEYQYVMINGELIEKD